MTAPLLAGLLPRAPRRADDACTHCWYCGAALGPLHEHDHVIPRRHMPNGPVAPTCRACHDLKDRTTFDEWPVDMILRALLACPQQDHARLLLTKMLAGQFDMRAAQ